MTLALDAALSGLRVAQQALDTASVNIANASTVGYTRKILPQETHVIAGQGFGVRSMELIRHVDAALISDLNKQTAVTEAYNIRLQYLARIQDFQGASDAGRALSTQLTSLSDAFTQLSTAPSNQTLLSNTVTAAQQTAGKINDFSTLITDMRNDAEADISISLTDINQSLQNIATLNGQIQRAYEGGRTSADLEDQRDIAIKNVAKYLDITTFADSKKLIVITKQGQTLADDTAHKLFFTTSNILPNSYYPGGGLNGLHVDSAGGTDITQTGLGGKIGALFTLRDETLPTYMAQLDEFAQKMAERFQNEGLKLFTDAGGSVPPSVASPGIVGYVGFSAQIQVNSAIVVDPTLIRNGTTGNVELPGSNEVIRRIAQFTFGSYQYQNATGVANISAGALIPTLGLTTQNIVVGNVNVSTYIDLGSIPGLALPGNFNLTIGGVPKVINILPTDTAANLVTTINTAFGGNVAGINSLGQLNIFSNSAITIAAGTIGAGGLAALGFNAGTTNPPNPSFQVQVGTRNPVIISIAPGDTSVNLLAALNAVPGLSAALNGGGQLVLTPTEGGDLKITDIAGGPLAAMGMKIANVAHTSFRQTNLGPDGTLSTGLLANSTLENYMSSIISTQGEEYSIDKNHRDQEDTYLKTLDARNTNTSGVNIDQEMSELIRVQTAYTAAARMISISQKMLDDLMSAFR